MFARHWATYVRALLDDATFDTERFAEEISDAERDMNTTTKSAQDALARARLARAKSRLRDARKHKAEIRQALLLDEDD